jgi:hypothetical protein
MRVLSASEQDFSTTQYSARESITCRLIDKLSFHPRNPFQNLTLYMHRQHPAQEPKEDLGPVSQKHHRQVQHAENLNQHVHLPGQVKQP